MFSNHKKSASLASIISYTPPKLHTGKNWYIDFSAYDPLEQKMKRKKYMLDGIPKITDRRRQANEIITNLNIKLRSGWNPWANVENSRQYTPYIDIIQRYHIYLEKLYAAGTIKENTLKDYEKRLRVFEEYTARHIPAIVYVYQIDQPFISDFLDYILLDRDSSARTRNNYRTWLSSLCNWMMEKQYLIKNPVENIRMLQEEEKKTVCPIDQRHTKTEEISQERESIFPVLMPVRLLYLYPSGRNNQYQAIRHLPEGTKGIHRIKHQQEPQRRHGRS